MFDRESRLFQLASTVCSVDDGGGDVGGGGGAGDSGGGDAGGGDAGGDTGGDAGVDAASPDGAVDVQDPNGGAGVDDTTPPDAAPAITPDVVEQMVQARLQEFAQAQQAQAEPPAYIQQILQQQAQQQQMWASMVQQAQQQQQMRAVEASRPRPPDPGAPMEEHLAYQRRDLAWQQQQQFGRLEGAFKQYTGQLESKLTALQARLDQAQAQAHRETYNHQTQQQLEQIARKPGMQWTQKPDAGAVLRTIHQVLSEANPNISLEQSASMIQQAFGLGAPTQAMKNAVRRDTSTEALKQQRDQVQKRGGPMPAANAARASALPKGKIDAVKQAIAAGAKLPPELLELYGIH